MSSPAAITYRLATSADVPLMEQSRLEDPSAGPADERMGAYLDGQHHPQRARAPRTAFVALEGARVIGYIAGHLTDRLGCQGEVQYLYVAPSSRRRGVARGLLSLLAEWLSSRGATYVCVDVDPTSPEAGLFYAACGAMPLNKGGWQAWSDIRAWLATLRPSP